MVLLVELCFSQASLSQEVSYPVFPCILPFESFLHGGCFGTAQGPTAHPSRRSNKVKIRVESMSARPDVGAQPFGLGYKLWPSKESLQKRICGVKRGCKNFQVSLHKGAWKKKPSPSMFNGILESQQRYICVHIANK